MKFINTEDFVRLIKNKFDDLPIIEAIDTTNPQPIITVNKTHFLELCDFLMSYPKLFFDNLACISAIDNGPEIGTIDVVYTFNSIPLEQLLHLKIVVEREASKCIIPSIASIWQTADWHEREAFDLVGVKFSNHPDLRRILLPADWKGHPLRKDYTEQQIYHGIKVKY